MRRPTIPLSVAVPLSDALALIPMDLGAVIAGAVVVGIVVVVVVVESAFARPLTPTVFEIPPHSSPSTTASPERTGQQSVRARSRTPPNSPPVGSQPTTNHSHPTPPSQRLSNCAGRDAAMFRKQTLSPSSGAAFGSCGRYRSVSSPIPFVRTMRTHYVVDKHLKCVIE